MVQKILTCTRAPALKIHFTVKVCSLRVKIFTLNHYTRRLFYYREECVFEANRLKGKKLSLGAHSWERSRIGKENGIVRLDTHGAW